MSRSTCHLSHCVVIAAPVGQTPPFLNVNVTGNNAQVIISKTHEFYCTSPEHLQLNHTQRLSDEREQHQFLTFSGP